MLLTQKNIVTQITKKLDKRNIPENFAAYLRL